MAQLDLQSFVDAVGDGVYTVDAEGACLFINASAVRLLGYDDAAELIGRNMHDAIHHTRVDGSAYPRAECPLLETARGGSQVRLENELLWRRDGTSFAAEYSAFPVFVDGRAVGSTITFAENKVRQDARIRLAVQHAVSHVLAGGVTRDQMMVDILRTVGDGLGWDLGLFWRQNGTVEQGLQLAARWQSSRAGSAIDLAKVAVSDITKDGYGPAARAWSSRRAVHIANLDTPESKPHSALASHHGVRSGFAVPVLSGSTTFGAFEFFSRELIEVDGTLLQTVSVVGQMVGQVLERQRALRTLRQSETRFSTIANAIPQLAWMTGPDGAMTWFNNRWYAFTGTTSEQMSGGGWLSVHHPDHTDRVVHNLQACFAAGQEWEDTFPLRGADGGYRWFLSRALPIRSDEDGEKDGAILGWFGTNTDISDLRAAEQKKSEALDEAEAANRAKSLFLTNMSHELRTPLTAIIGYAEMLVEEVEGGAEPEEVVRDLGKVETNARHLLGLINDVLDLSKVESGKMEAFAETFEVADMVRDVAATVTSLVAKNDNRLDLQVPDDLGVMHSDVTRIRQMLLNLLGNAAKFTEAGRITLAVRREPGPAGADWLSFAVGDTGLGMSEAQVAKLFQRFQQADASTTRRFGGTGLGLSLTRAFAELLGGTIDVRSTLGQGSTFTVRVPAELPTALDEPHGALATDGGPNRRTS